MTNTQEQMEQIRGDFLLRFRRYRKEYIDDLPEKSLRELKLVDPNYHLYKCKGSFRQGLYSDIDYLIENRLISAEEISQARQYYDWIQSLPSEYMLKQKDIDMINQILDFLIKALT